MVEVVTQRLAQADAAGGYLLDGFPRTMAQAEALGAELAKQGARGKVDGVIVHGRPDRGAGLAHRRPPHLRELPVELSRGLAPGQGRGRAAIAAAAR